MRLWPEFWPSPHLNNRLKHGPRRSGTLLVLLLAGAAGLSGSGCVSQSSAKAREQAAFLAGQRQGRLEALQAEMRGPSVTIMGPVRNPAVPWTMDLTLAKAIVAAGYTGKSDPTQITIVRSGRTFRVDVNKFLAGQDLPLQPRDVVELRSD